MQLNSSHLFITVIICTRNRSSLLAKAISSLTNQTYPATSFEILVIDNGSTDDTPAIISQIAKQSRVSIRYIHESQIGLSIAKNRGWQEAKGDIVAFLDDDAMAIPEWINKFVEVFISNERAEGVGGPISPVFESPPPSWIPASILTSLAYLDFGEKVKEIEWPEFLPGGNSAFRRNLLERIGGFDTRFGRQGASLRATEDPDFCIRAIKSGNKLFYSPKMIIHHFIPEARFEVDYLFKRSYWASRSVGFFDFKHFGFIYLVSHILFESIRTISRSIKILYFKLIDRQDNYLLWKFNFWSGVGYISSIVDVACCNFTKTISKKSS